MNGEQSDRPGAPGPEPSEEEMRAALEAELKRIKVGDVLLQTVVSLLNVGGRRAGLAPGTEGERDLAQVHTAIEGVRALLPVLEGAAAADERDLRSLRDALSQLQLAYAKLGGSPQAPEQGRPGKEPPAAEQPPGAQPPPDSKSGPAQSSGRLWVPGQ